MCVYVCVRQPTHHVPLSPSPKSDVYALGCSLYELLTLRTAYDDKQTGLFPQPLPDAFSKDLRGADVLCLCLCVFLCVPVCSVAWSAHMLWQIWLCR